MIQVRGLDELSRELRRVDPRLEKSTLKATTRIAERIAGQTRGHLRNRSRSGLTSKANSIVISGSNPVVRSALFGESIHWVFGRPVSAASMSRRVFPPWVGPGWKPEDLYGFEVDDRYAEKQIGMAWEEALHAAFPD
jgi:hypothetical protein